MAYAVLRKEDFNIDYFNDKAKVVIVGISPGPSQKGVYDPNLTVKENNRKCAFRGNTSIQNNLSRMLNYIGINTYLKIDDCSKLWEKTYFELVNFTSIFPFSVLEGVPQDTDRYTNDEAERNKSKVKFISSITYKEMMKSDLLQKQFKKFLDHVEQYKNNPIYIACGASVYDVLNACESMKGKTIIPIVHPSGVNNERVSLYCDDEITPIQFRKEAREKMKELI